jgi:hyperosmotically inducible periplasmic protein
MKKHFILILALFVAAFAFQGCKDAKQEAAEDRAEAREDAREENTTASEEAKKDTEEFKDDAEGIANEAKKDADEAGDEVADSDIGEETKEVGRDIKEGVQEAGSELKDAGITTAVKAKFAADDLVKASNIDVDTENGVVTLNGTVGSKKESTQAVTLAKTVDGVRSVRNRLKITG